MASEPTLEGLPSDILEILSRWLDLQDLCNLRRTSREINDRLVQGRFKEFFKQKRIKFTRPELERFARVTRPGSLGCHLQSLCIVGEVNILNNDGSAELLCTAFVDLATSSGRGYLELLSLQMPSEDSDVDVRGTNWQRRWGAGNELFRDVMTALRQSGLSVGALDVFGKTRHCSLGIDQLKDAPLKWFRGIRSLKLSLTHPLPLPDSVGVHEEYSAEGDPGHAHRIASLLEACPHLEELDLHWYTNISGRALTPTETSQKHFLNHITSPCPNLKTLTLRGTPCKSRSLLTIIQAAPLLDSITLENIHLTEDSFNPIFTHLTSLPSLNHIHLNELSESGNDPKKKGGRVHFNGPGKPHYRTAARLVRPYHLTRKGDECRRLIEYFVYGGRAKGSPELFRWRDRRMEVYGPPTRAWRIGRGRA